MFDTVIFDLDGTLLNTLDDLHDACNYALNQINEKPKTKEEVRLAVGNGIKKLMERLVLKKENLEVAYKSFKIYYHQNICNKSRPYDGILSLLNELKKKNIKMAILSNKYDSGVKKLGETFFKEYMNLFNGDSEKWLRKPNCQGLLETIKSLSSNIDKTIYVGDTKIDYETAKNACVKSCIVTWGFRKMEELANIKPDFIINEPNELLKYL